MRTRPDLLARLARHAPHVRLGVERFSPARLPALVTGEIDVAVLSDMALPSAGLRREPLFEEPFVVIARPDHLHWVSLRAPMIDNRAMRHLAGLEQSAIAVWLMDLDPIRIVWANDGAVALWRAESRDDLLARDLRGAPASVVTRTNAIFERVRAGEVVVEEWTLYPKGVPAPIRIHFSAVPLDDGRLGLLNQALPSEAAANANLLRGIEALRHVPVVIALVAEDDTILMQNPAALRAFGERSTWASWFSEPTVPKELTALARRGEAATRRLGFQTSVGERVHSVHVHATKDPVSGKLAFLVHQTDATDRVLDEERAAAQREVNQRLEATVALVEQQRNDILALSAPILDVGDDTIAMPLIGDIDEARTQEVTERLLPVITARRASNVILDMTGAVMSSEAGAARLMQMVAAVRLLGARPMVTGVKPALALQLVALGFANTDIFVARSLADGLSRIRGSD